MLVGVLDLHFSTWRWLSLCDNSFVLLFLRAIETFISDEFILLHEANLTTMLGFLVVISGCKRADASMSTAHMALPAPSFL